MRRAVLVHIHGEAGVLADQRPGGAGVVQVDVREEHGVEVAHAEAASPELLVQSVECGAGARVDNGVVTVRFEKADSNGTRPPHPEIVKRGDRVHQQRSVAQDGKVHMRQLGAARRKGVTREPSPGDP